MDRFLLMHSFARAVETGSFSAVARELGTGQPNVSRHIAALEQHLGARLLHRSTRRLSLTPEGERYYTETRRVLDAVAEAESNARGEDSPRGLLRVACPTVLGRTHLLPLVKPLLQRYPELDLDLQIGDRFIDLVEEGVDLAIRIGALKDSALKARRIGAAERVCVASPSYLARHPAPRTPEDLPQHNCIVYTLSSSGNAWSFRDREVAVGGRFRVNSPDGARSAVLDGIGIAYTPVWLFEDALRDGRVQALLPGLSGPPTPIHIVYSAKRLLPRRAAVFMDFIAEAFGREPMLNEGGLEWLLRRRPA
ncbi:MAG TPA: LysR family transcriptional regulator [Nevskia sp.]|jgi:LysR family transcriptional regulator for bpeEF and oprC|nr:LysR family transcriptional regulator [Nevskia sp.]